MVKGKNDHVLKTVCSFFFECQMRDGLDFYAARHSFVAEIKQSAYRLGE